MKLRPVALGLAFGIIWGAAILTITWWLLIIGSPGQTISLLGIFYLGYSFSFFGGLVGLFWGFVDGFIVGMIVAVLYNVFAKERSAF